MGGTFIGFNKATNPAGNNGEIQFNDGGAFGASSNLFWDNPNSRLGLGTITPQARLDIRAQGALSTDVALRVRNSANTVDLFAHRGDGTFTYRSNDNTAFINYLGNGNIQFLGQSRVITLNVGDLAGLSSNGLTLGFTNGQARYLQYSDGNFQFERSVGILKTSGQGCISIRNAITVPTTSTAERIHFYSADITAGNAAPHFRTENGDVIKLYKTVDAVLGHTVNTGDADTDALIEAIVRVLRDTGLADAT